MILIYISPTTCEVERLLINNLYYYRLSQILFFFNKVHNNFSPYPLKLRF